MHILYQVIGNAGDGSNFIDYFTDPLVSQKVDELASDGDERYASGDGLQERQLKFRTAEALSDFVLLNNIALVTLGDFDEVDYWNDY